MKKIYRVKRRFVEQGLEAALEKRTAERSHTRKADGDFEAHLVALSCSAPPAGHARWSLRLPADRMVALQYVEAMSRDGFLPARYANLNRRNVPEHGPFFQAALAVAIALTSSFSALLVHLGFTSTIFSGLTIIDLIRLRRVGSSRHRVCWGYPLPPLIFLIFVTWVTIFSVQPEPLSALAGLAMVVVGYKGCQPCSDGAKSMDTLDRCRDRRGAHLFSAGLLDRILSAGSCGFSLRASCHLDEPRERRRRIRMAVAVCPFRLARGCSVVADSGHSSVFTRAQLGFHLRMNRWRVSTACMFNSVRALWPKAPESRCTTGGRRFLSIPIIPTASHLAKGRSASSLPRWSFASSSHTSRSVSWVATCSLKDMCRYWPICSTSARIRGKTARRHASETSLQQDWCLSRPLATMSGRGFQRGVTSWWRSMPSRVFLGETRGS